MTLISIAERLGTDVSSRANAAALRCEIVAAGSPVVLDFSNVETVSDSFTDELIAVIVERYGKSWFREHVKIIGLNPLDRDSLVAVVRRRLENVNVSSSQYDSKLRQADA